MPIIHANIIEGRSQQQKEDFCRDVAEAAARHLDVKLQQVRVLLHEVPAEHWTVGGVTKAELDARAKESGS